MRRLLLNLLTIMSLLLLVAAATMWVRSHHVGDHLQWQWAENRGGSHYSWYLVLSSGAGGLAVCRNAEVSYVNSITTQEAARPLDRWEYDGWVTRSTPAYPSRGFFSAPVPPPGFALHWKTMPGTVTRDVILPYWAVVAAAGGLPVLWLTRWRRNRCRTPGHCRSCGYDLRATPERCPECGMETRHEPI